MEVRVGNKISSTSPRNRDFSNRAQTHDLPVREFPFDRVSSPTVYGFQRLAAQSHFLIICGYATPIERRYMNRNCRFSVASCYTKSQLISRLLDVLTGFNVLWQWPSLVSLAWRTTHYWLSTGCRLRGQNQIVAQVAVEASSFQEARCSYRYMSLHRHQTVNCMSTTFIWSQSPQVKYLPPRNVDLRRQPLLCQQANAQVGIRVRLCPRCFHRYESPMHSLPPRSVSDCMISNCL